ncbi:unnamed protein product, partial [Nesidiocoris tenuis]
MEIDQVTPSNLADINRSGQFARVGLQIRGSTRRALEPRLDLMPTNSFQVCHSRWRRSTRRPTSGKGRCPRRSSRSQSRLRPMPCRSPLRRTPSRLRPWQLRPSNPAERNWSRCLCSRNSRIATCPKLRKCNGSTPIKGRTRCT